MTFHADPLATRAAMAPHMPPAAPLEMPQQVLERRARHRSAQPTPRQRGRRLLPRLLSLRMARLMRLASPVLRLR
ncbi:MAG: hypothetical protein ABNH26_12035 [Celeribacter sp.]